MVIPTFARMRRDAGVVALVLLAAAPAASQSTAPPAPPPASARVEIVNYAVAQSRALFGDRGRAWLETSVRVAGTARRGRLTVGAEALGVRTSGRDPFGTGSPAVSGAAGATFGAARVDKAYVELAAGNWRVTAGRQHIIVGTQFLIGDGVYDGFSAGSQHGVYHNPRRGVDGVRAQGRAGAFDVDAIAFRVDPSWDAAGGRDGVVAGVDVTRKAGHAGGTWSASLFHRASRSDLDNDMTVVASRVAQPLDAAERLTVSGEWVFETGTCRNAIYCDIIGMPLGAHAWHLEAAARAKNHPRAPWVEAGLVRYGRDFAPIATGFADWGRWYLGNQIDWIVFGTNTLVARAEAGFAPGATTKLRAQFHHTRAAYGSGGSLANEVTVIGEWYPRDALWVNAVVGGSRPGAALEHGAFQNPFAFMNSGAAPVGGATSIDVVVAVGVKF